MNVIITGATKGMGLAIAEKFAEGGYNIIACSRSAGELEKLKNNFAGKFPGVTVDTMTADIGNANDVKAFARWILASGFTPDVLVNNAGYFAEGKIYNEEEGVLQKMLDVNLNGAYHLTRALLSEMMQRKSGHIFNNCSIASVKPMGNVGSYGISKFAIYGFTKHLREEMKPYGIKVTAIVPGATYTWSWEGSGIDKNRILEAEDVATMVFACSQLSPAAVVEDIIIRPQLGDL